MLEWLGSALHVPDTVRNLFEVGDKRRARRIQREIAALMFWNNGPEEILLRIAQGKSTAEDAGNLKRLVSMSQYRVFAAELYLDEHRNQTVEVFGAEIANKIDCLIDVNLGCGRLREKIGEHAGQGITAEQAEHLLKRITQLNELAQEIPPSDRRCRVSAR